MKKKGQRNAAPSHTTVICLELVQALVQIWLRIVRPVV
jgi:hypothetical protein